MRYHIFIYIALFVLIASSCQSSNPSSPSPTPTEIQEATPIPSTSDPNIGYPVEGYPAGPTPTLFDYSSDDVGYPAPETTPFYSDYPDQLEIPTPEADTGIVTGQLLTPGPGGEPYYSTVLLADTIPADQEGYPPMIGFSEQDSPSAVQDKLGVFLFVDVPPGLYALALWSPISSTIIQEPDSPDYMLIEVKAGETTDLGIVSIP
jgi:hypothetical protein